MINNKKQATINTQSNCKFDMQVFIVDQLVIIPPNQR